MKFNKQKAAPVAFQLAPMIDIIFLLLAFFIVTYQMSDAEKPLDVKIPTAEQGKAKKRGYTERVVNIHKDGSIGINRRPYTLDDLEKKMADYIRVDKNQPVRIRADKDARFEHVIQVIDRCRKAGVWNISFATVSAKKVKK